jgi:hypothetical protein
MARRSAPLRQAGSAPPADIGVAGAGEPARHRVVDEPSGPPWLRRRPSSSSHPCNWMVSSGGTPPRHPGGSTVSRPGGTSTLFVLPVAGSGPAADDGIGRGPAGRSPPCRQRGSRRPRPRGTRAAGGPVHRPPGPPPGRPPDGRSHADRPVDLRRQRRSRTPGRRPHGADVAATPNRTSIRPSRVRRATIRITRGSSREGSPATKCRDARDLRRGRPGMVHDERPPPRLDRGPGPGSHPL